MLSASQNPTSPEMHRREAEVAAALPRALPVPELLGAHDDGEWVTLVFEEVVGVPPNQPWTLPQLGSTFRALDEVAALATPCPVDGLRPFAEQHRLAFSGFRALAGGKSATDGLDGWTRRHLDRLAELESEWESAAAGGSLVHSDVRADNLVVAADGGVVIVDWPHACVGAAWLDKLCMLPSVPLGGGPSPALVEAELRPFGGIEVDVVDRVLVALAGYFTHRGYQPDPVGLPTLRAFQRAQGDISRRWLAERLRLD